MAQAPQGAMLPVIDSASGRGDTFKHSDPLAGVLELDCSYPGTGAAESHLPLSFPLK